MTDANIPVPSRWGPGEKIDHRKLNEPVDAIQRIIADVAAPRQIRATSQPAGSGSGSLSAQWFQIKTIADDYLVCNEWDGDEASDEDIYVARPYELRKTPFDGETVNGYAFSYNTLATERTSTGGGDSEDQVIVPEYFVGQIILAIELDDTLVTVSGSAVTWQEFQPARQWAKKYVAV